MIPSIILNSLIVLMVLWTLAAGYVKLRRAKDRPARLFRYFTTLSNLLCVIASITVVTAWAGRGALPLWTVVLKYVGTCAVTVTMLTVLLLLGPVSGEWKMLLWGGDGILHLVAPVLAIVSFLAFEKTAMPAWVIALGVCPVALYAVLYCRKVIYAPAERRWEDFYGFNAKGKWPLSAAVMLLGSAAVAFALWAVR